MTYDLYRWRHSILAEQLAEADTTEKARMIRGMFGIDIALGLRNTVRVTVDVRAEDERYPITRFLSAWSVQNALRLATMERRDIIPFYERRDAATLYGRPTMRLYPSSNSLRPLVLQITTPDLPDLQWEIQLPTDVYPHLIEVLEATAMLATLAGGSV